MQRARRGVYPPNIALDVSPERLHRFFIKRDDGFQVARRVRDVVVFSLHNLGGDSPFSRIDLVSCRNLLIYLQPSLQAAVLRHLHYSLNANGFLLLGNSETVGDSPELFSLLDRKNKIYVRKAVASFGSLEARQHQPGRTADDAGAADGRHLAAHRHHGRARRAQGARSLRAARRRHQREPRGPALSRAHQPVSRAGVRRGEPELLRLARPELHVDLRRAIAEAQSSGAQVSVASKVDDDGAFRPFRLDVLPIVDPQTQGNCRLILFHEPQARRPLPPSSAPGIPPSQAEHRILDLERELLLTKEYLQETIEELEGANEELQSSNEELQSSNEELQSTNEELETSKEELQSTNEELTTVNDELQNRMVELQEVNDDFHNVLSGVENAVVIASLDQRIRRFTHAAARLFELGPSDIDRPLAHLSSFIGSVRLDQLAASVIDSLAPFEEEVRGADQRWYLLRITPYKTLERQIQGTVIVLSDIDARKRSLVLDGDVADYASRFLRTISQPLMILDDGARVVWANEPFYAGFQLVAEETVGNLLVRLGDGLWARPELTNHIVGTAATGAPFRNLRLTQTLGGGGNRAVKISGRRLPPLGEQSSMVLLSLEKV